MREVFPEVPPEEIARRARAVYRHFGAMLAECVRLPDVTPDTVDSYVDWGGQDATLAALLAEGKGILYATGHIGNWEAGGFFMHLKGLSAGAVARPLDNPRLDRYVKSIRQARGQAIWDKRGVVRTVVRALRNGGAVGMLVDQDGGRAGEFVPFFGRPASTLTTPVDLALRTGTPIVVAGMHRADRPMRFRFRMREPLRPDPDADRSEERARLLRAVNDGLEALIREEPAQWLWLHRRWKTRPKDETF